MQRICIILPIEEGGIPEFLQKKTDLSTDVMLEVQAMKFNWGGKKFVLNRTTKDMHKAFRSFLSASE